VIQNEWDAQNFSVTENGTYIFFELYQMSKLVTPVLERLVVTLKSIIRAGEDINDGTDSLGQRNWGLRKWRSRRRGSRECRKRSESSM
jgi:hypothetical protein